MISFLSAAQKVSPTSATENDGFFSSRLEAIQVEGISYIKYRASAQQPRTPLPRPSRLHQQAPRREYGEDHRQQRRRCESPFGSQQPNGYRNSALKHHRARDIPDGQPILLLIEPQEAVGHLRQLGRKRRDEQGQD